MSTAPNRREVDSLTAQTPTWKRLTTLIVNALPAFSDAAHHLADKLRADKSQPFVALAEAIVAAIPTHAPSSAPDLAAATTFDARSLVCAELLFGGQWKTSTPKDLATAWGVNLEAISNYRRAGAVARQAMSLDLDEKLDDTLANLLRQQEQAERIAEKLEAARDFGEGARYRAIALQARRHYADVAGLVQHRMSISLEADPRIAGMYQAILAALKDRDRQEDARRVSFDTWLGEVEKLTGGVLPPGLPEWLPSAREHVREAVKRYEAEIGARRLAA